MSQGFKYINGNIFQMYFPRKLSQIFPMTRVQWIPIWEIQIKLQPAR